MHSLCVASSAVEYLLLHLQEQLSLLQISQLAPATTASQTNHAITTMVFISFAERFAHAGKLPQEKDPQPARIDSFVPNKVDKEESTELRGNRAEDKMRSLATERSKNSFRSGRFVLDPAASVKESPKDNQSNNNNNNTPSSFFISLYPETEIDGKEQNMRQAENDRVALEAKTKKQHDEEMRQREKNVASGLKLLREKKPITFDYEGASQGISPSRLPADTVRRMRQELRGGQVLKRDRMCETTQVANPRQRQQISKSLRGEGPVFSEKTFSVVQALGDNSHLAEGVKITQLRGNSNNVTIQHRLKRPQGKPYRLKDYKDLSKDKSFREFPLASSRKSSILDLSADNHEDDKLKTIRKERPIGHSRGKSEEAIKAKKAEVLDEALGRGLPFIRTKGLKFYDIGSTNSFKTVDFSFNSSERRTHWRNKIKIPDASLYEEVLLS